MKTESSSPVRAVRRLKHHELFSIGDWVRSTDMLQFHSWEDATATARQATGIELSLDNLRGLCKSLGVTIAPRASRPTPEVLASRLDALEARLAQLEHLARHVRERT